MQPKCRHLTGKSGHKFVQTGTAALGQIAAAGDGSKPLSAQRADLVGKCGDRLQACRRGGDIFSFSARQHLRISAVLRVGREGIAAVRYIACARLRPGDGQIDKVSQTEPPFGDLMSPPGDPLDEHWHAAKARQHRSLRILDALGEGDLLLARKPCRVAHLTEVSIDQTRG